MYYVQFKPSTYFNAFVLEYSNVGVRLEHAIEHMEWYVSIYRNTLIRSYENAGKCRRRAKATNCVQNKELFAVFECYYEYILMHLDSCVYV